MGVSDVVDSPSPKLHVNAMGLNGLGTWGGGAPRLRSASVGARGMPMTRALKSKSDHVFERTRCITSAMYVGRQSITSYCGSGTLVATLPRPKTVIECCPCTLPSSSLQRVTGQDEPWCPSMTVCRKGSVP